jgi:hypothetical protein
MNDTFGAFPELENLPCVKLGERMEVLDAKIKDAEEVVSGLKKEFEHIRVILLPKRLEAEGLKNFRLASGRGITTTPEMFVSVLAGDKPAFIQWLKDSGQAGIVKEDVNPQTLKAFVKERIENAEEYPADIVKVTIIPKARFFK